MLNVTNSTLKAYTFLQFWVTTDICPSRLLLVLLLVFSLKVYDQKHSQLLVLTTIFSYLFIQSIPALFYICLYFPPPDGSNCSHYIYKLHCKYLYILETESKLHLWGFRSSRSCNKGPNQQLSSNTIKKSGGGETVFRTCTKHHFYIHTIYQTIRTLYMQYIVLLLPVT